MSSSSGCQRRLERPDEEVVRADHARTGRPGDLDRAAEGEQRHRQVGGRVGVRERAADRAPVPDLRVADLRGGVGEYRRLGLEQLGIGHLGVPGGRADDHLVALDPDAGQLGDPGDVDQHGGLGQPHLHHRQQRMAAGQQLGVLAVLGQQRQRVRGGVGDLVVERRGDHARAHGPVGGVGGPGRGRPTASPPRRAPTGRCCGSRCSGRSCPQGLPAPPARSGAGSPPAGWSTPSPCRGCRIRTAGRGSRGTPAAPGSSCRRRPPGPRPWSPTGRCAWTASTVQDLTDSPSSSTVQAPQEVVSQPTLAARRPRVSRR